MEEWKEHYSKNRTIKTWFENNQETKFQDLIINPKSVNNEKLHLISSNIDLINTELELVAKLYSNLHFRKKQNYLKVHQILKSGIDKLEGYDVVIMDCPPNFNIITRNAIVSSDYYLVPVKLDYLSKIVLGELKKHIKDLTNTYNTKVKMNSMKINPQLVEVVCNMVDKRKDSLISTEKNYLTRIQKDNSIFKSKLRQNKTFYLECQQELIPVSMKDISTHNTYFEVKKDTVDVTSFEKLHNEVLSCNTREDAKKLFEDSNFKKCDLLSMGEYYNLKILKIYNKTKMIALLVEFIVGNKIDDNSIF